jgi:hypothetical protein
LLWIGGDVLIPDGNEIDKASAACITLFHLEKFSFEESRVAQFDRFTVKSLISLSEVGS